MRILYLGNNWTGWQVLRWLREQGEEIVGLSIHEEHKRKHWHEIVRAADVPLTNIFDASKLREPETLEAIRALKPDIAVSVFFGYILKRDFIDIFPHGVINLHPSYLPYNRGSCPNVWSIVDGTPAGVSLHYIDEGIDTGDIIARRRVEQKATDTGKTLYQRLEKECVALFRDIWPIISSGRNQRTPQEDGGTLGRLRDLPEIAHIDRDETVKAGDLINVLRALTFPPYAGAYFMDGNERVYMRLELLREEELGNGS